MDIFGSEEQQKNELKVEVRFGQCKGQMHGVLPSNSSSVFGSRFLNQLKVSLSILGSGLSNLNILAKESLDKLVAVASGTTDSSDYKSITTEFWQVLGTLYPEYSSMDKSGVAAIKLYVVDKDYNIFQSIFGYPIQRFDSIATISDVLNVFDLDEFPVVVQGVEMRKETPMYFIRNECYYSDGFVHLVVFKR